MGRDQGGGEGAALAAFLPTFDVNERHARVVAATPEEVLAAALAVRVGSDPVTRLLLRVRGMRRRSGSIREFFEAHGFEVLRDEPTEFVAGATGTPWRLSGGLRPWREGGRGTVRVAFELRADAHPEGARRSTETRIAAADDAARRAFRRYWLVVGPFSSLIRRRWLAAASRAIDAANRSTAPSPNDR